MPTVLIIDDNDDLRDTLVVLLEDEGHATIAARNGETGLQMFAERSPDVVLTDIIMPDSDGIETIRRIRTLDPQARIIAMSGGSLIGNDYYLRIARTLGAIEVLPKPFEVEDLVQVVERCLRTPPALSRGAA